MKTRELFEATDKQTEQIRQMAQAMMDEHGIFTVTFRFVVSAK